MKAYNIQMMNFFFKNQFQSIQMLVQTRKFIDCDHLTDLLIVCCEIRSEEQRNGCFCFSFIGRQNTRLSCALCLNIKVQTPHGPISVLFLFGIWIQVVVLLKQHSSFCWSKHFVQFTTSTLSLETPLDKCNIDSIFRRPNLKTTIKLIIQLSQPLKIKRFKIQSRMAPSLCTRVFQPFCLVLRLMTHLFSLSNHCKSILVKVATQSKDLSSSTFAQVVWWTIHFLSCMGVGSSFRRHVVTGPCVAFMKQLYLV